MMRAKLTMALCLGIAGCGSCGGASASLRVDGPTPYVRCTEVDPPGKGRLEVGKAALVIEGRTLRVDGLEGPVRIAAFSGPGPSPAAMDGALGALAKSFAPQLVFVVGGLSGAGPEVTRARVEALGRLGVPVILLAGGRDGAEDWDVALSDPVSGVVDGRGLARVKVGGHTFLPLSGAPFGRYAVGPGACGFGDEDLASLAERLEEVGDGALVVGWAAPTGLGPGLYGVEPGSAELGEVLGDAGGIFAWPRRAPGPVSPDAPGRFTVRPLVGGPVLSAEGASLSPGPTRLELHEAGLRMARER